MALSVMASVIVCVNATETVDLHQITSSVPEFQLTGDDYTSYVSTLWEWDLANVDGNQNQMSMAKCGNTLYVCVTYFDDVENRKGNLFLCKYSVETGEHLENITIETPNDFKPGMSEQSYAIVSDDDGNLIVALAKPDAKGKMYCIDMRKVDFSGNEPQLLADTAVQIELPNMTASKYEPWMERLNDFSGSFDDGQFSFYTTVGRLHDSRWRYTGFDIVVDTTLPLDEQVSVDEKYLRVKGEHYQNSSPDMVLFPGSVSSYVTTLNQWMYGDNDNVSTGMVNPTLIQDGYTTDDNLGVFDWHSSDKGYCRGFYPFYHNGHALAVYGASNNETDGATFRVITLPGEQTFFGAEELFTIPSTPFPAGGEAHKAYPKNYLQLVVVEPLENQMRNNVVSEVTRLYVCAPGCGIAAYELVTPMSAAGVESVEFENANVRIEGWNLMVDNSEVLSAGTRVEVFDFSGRKLHSSRLTSTSHDLSFLAPGIYLVKVGRQVLKVHLR